MAYFNYHAKVKKRMKEVGVKDWEIVTKYHNISPCLIITLQSGESYPIREHKFFEYLTLIDNLYKKEE